MTPSEYKSFKNLDQNRTAVVEGGSVAGKARLDLEKKTQHRVTSKDNFKTLTKKNKAATVKNT
jgi:hypothetical protein